MKFRPLFLLAVFISVIVSFSTVYAKSSSMEVATDSNFSNQTLNFNLGQTVYVRLSVENDGKDRRVLNLRDNQYNLLQSYTLVKISDNQFSTSLNAPQSDGYYSLEAQVESGSNVVTSVKTIKVGNPQNANVKVNVQSNVAGQSVTRQDLSQEPSPSQNQSSPAINSQPQSSGDPAENPELLGNPDFTFEQPLPFLVQISLLMMRVWDSFWPF